ncbi:MAG: hypothetical protein KKF41_04365 [Actinobacteria bacterium]|nr:hypothetical protein [Actinomycetota bacterium]MBU1943444.1 hypothetical protein [Actinomycetota bacterium]MBU2686801.1 hypothetical protein [Actinomycetota bacterium]
MLSPPGRLARDSAFRAETLVPPGYFAVLSIAVWGPALFSGGYVLLGDMVFTPAMHPTEGLLGPARGTMNVTVVYWLAWLVSRLIGSVLLEKVVLFLLGFLPGYLMYRNAPSKNAWGRFFAGTLYAVNPFIYTRILMGQWGFVLGYALLPVVLASTLKTAREPSAARCARTALWLALTSLLSLHAGAIAVLVCAVAGLFQLRRTAAGRRRLAALAAVLGLFILLAGFWLLPAFESGESPGIGAADLEAFRTRTTSDAGLGLSVLGMYGFWKTQLDGLMPRKYVPLWPLFGLGFLALAACGLWTSRSRPRVGGEACALGLLGLTGFLLALGSRAPVTGPAFSWLFRNVGGFALFREPQKFSGLLVLAFAGLGSLGVERLATRRSADPQRHARIMRFVGAGLLVLVLLYGFRMLGGLWGQAKAVSYPRSWSEAQSLLEEDAGDWKALYLPPYWYMRFDFADSDYTITSPMPFYFTCDYVKLNALVVGGVELNAAPVDRYVRAALESGRERGNLGAMLTPLDVKYIVFARNPAGAGFDFVLRQRDLEVVRDWGDIVVLRNTSRVGRLVLCEGEGTYRDWDVLGAGARGGNLVGSWISGGSRTRIPDLTGTPVVHTERAFGTVTATVPVDAEPGTLLFAEQYDEGWRLDGEAPAEQIGLTCAFEVGDRGGRMTLRFLDPVIVIGYSVTAAGLVICLVLVGIGSRRSRKPGRDT